MRRTVKRITRIVTTTSWTVVWDGHPPSAVAAPASRLIIEQEEVTHPMPTDEANPPAALDPYPPDLIADQGDPT